MSSSCRYQLIYPFVNNKIHRTKDQNKGIYSCYLDLKQSDEFVNLLKDPIFIVLNIDEQKIMKYKIKPKVNPLTSYQEKLTHLESRVFHLEKLITHLL